MAYIIDGNNLIGSSRDISLDDKDAREKLVNLIRKFQESKNAKITVVFDGDPGGSQLKNAISAKLTVVFPRYGNTADDEIKRILNGYHQPNDVVLVSSDRELKKFAKEKGAKTRNSIEFYYELKKSHYLSGKKEETLKRINTSLSQNEIENWMKIFNQK
jgi:predicted RNA-binding protein with PIN domain